MNCKQIEKLSPVKIEYVRLPDGGRFYYSTSPPHIEIRDDVNDMVKATALLHEIGHAVCYTKGCRCFEKPIDHRLTEYHAYKFVMVHIKNDKRLQRQFIRDIKFVLHNVRYPDHAIAAERITKSKQWAKFCKI